MKELINLVEALNEVLKQKENEVFTREDTNSYTLGHLNNRKNDIQIFADSIQAASKDPFFKKEIILNFTNIANEIEKEIDLI